MVETFLNTIIVHVVKYGNHLKLVRERQVTHLSNMKQRSGKRMQDCRRNLLSVLQRNGDRGSTVIKVLCYKSEGRWFDSR